MNTNRGYIILPKLIEQPTWGGYYIAEFKGWKNAAWASKKIGQSYELYSKSYLSLSNDSHDHQVQPIFDNAPKDAISIQSLIAIDINNTLGDKVRNKFNGYLKTLIKFTQAKGNSYQIHIKPAQLSEKWQAKPESWFFFEKGIATLGIKSIEVLPLYKQACIDIDKFMQSLSQKVLKKSMTIDEANKQAKAYISEQNIIDYVNLISIEKDTIVDLHEGGVHHSWEENDIELPLGNIVYEVQLDVEDENSTIRSFDKGKIKEDGTIRSLQIEDYFTYLDTSEKANEPQIHMSTPQRIDNDINYDAQKIFETPDYSLHRLLIRNSIFNHHTDTNHMTFHHLFICEGSVLYKDELVSLSVHKGHAIFIPASVGKYSLTSIGEKAVILKTFI